MSVHVIIPGHPVPKERPRVVNGRAHTPKRTRAYEAMAAMLCRSKVREPLSGDVHVRLLLVFGSHVHGDLDNCAKSVLDAAQGIAFGNDKSISKLTVWREYDKSNPRAELWVEVAA